MYAILTETKETILLKKKQIEQNQTEVNAMVYQMAEKVQKIQQLGQQVELLETELYRLEKQIASEGPDRQAADNGCCIKSPAPTPRNYCDR